MAYPHYRSPFRDTTLTKVFVGGLAWETPTVEMRRYFEQFGEILEAVIITDKNTGKSKGYGFVTFRDPESARRACIDPNPVIDGRRANCNIASLGRPRPSTPRGRNQGSSPYQGVAQQGAPSYSGVAASVPQPPAPPPPPPAPVIYPPYGYQTYSPEFMYHQPTMFGENVIEWACRVSIIHKFSSHNTIINCMDHHLPQWGLHTIMAILYKLPEEHFLHPRHNVDPDRPIFTTRLRWRGPTLPHPFISLGIPFPLPQIHRHHSIPPQKQKPGPSLLKVQKRKGKNSSMPNVPLYNLDKFMFFLSPYFTLIFLTIKQ